MINVPTSDDIVNVAQKYKPWAGSWWSTLIQGLLALALGIFLFMNPQKPRGCWRSSLRSTSSLAASLPLKRGHAFWLRRGWAGSPTIKGWRAQRLGVHSSSCSQWLSADTGLLLLGVGLLIYGTIWVFSSLCRQKQKRPDSWLYLFRALSLFGRRLCLLSRSECDEDVGCPCFDAPGGWPYRNGLHPPWQCAKGQAEAESSATPAASELYFPATCLCSFPVQRTLQGYQLQIVEET